MLYNGVVIFYVGNGRFYVATAFVSRSREDPALHQDGSAFLNDFLQCVFVVGNCGFIDQRTDVHGRVQGIANGKLAVGLFQRVDDFGKNGFVDN